MKRIIFMDITIDSNICTFDENDVGTVFYFNFIEDYYLKYDSIGESVHNAICLTDYKLYVFSPNSPVKFFYKAVLKLQ